MSYVLALGAMNTSRGEKTQGPDMTPRGPSKGFALC